LRNQGHGRGFLPSGTRQVLKESAMKAQSQRRLPAHLRSIGLALITLLIFSLFFPSPAMAAVSVSKAELKGTSLRVEGTALANRTITIDGVAMGTSDGSGRFKIERSSFSAPADCTVDVNDGSVSATSARLSGCTVQSDPPPATVTALDTLTLSQTTVVGGNPVTGTVTLTAGAPSGGFTVTLSSNNTAAATVPPSLTVPAGETRGSFTITTETVTNSQSSTIIATADGVTRSSTLTVTTERDSTTGSVSLSRGGTGSGRVTSSPAGIDCTFTADSTSGTCSNAFFPAGTEVRLEARAADGSKFIGWESENSCPDAPKVTVQAGIAHICRPAFVQDN
jgi:hypothetical protein